MKRKLALFITLALAALLLLTACSGAKFGVHKVTFDADGGELSFFEGSKNVQTYGTVDLPIPTKEGYVFEGWFIGEGVNEAQFTATSMVTSDITLKAKWRQAEYTVTFVDYYGKSLSHQTVKYGEAATAPVAPRIAEEKLRFDAWDTDFSAVKSDLTVTALYVIDSYTITYVTNNTQTIPAVSYFFDETPRIPPEPGLGGHYFIGWYLDEAFTTEYTFDAPLTSDITLYAYFNESIPIETIDELLAIPEYSNNKYFLKNDIDCEGAVITTSIVGFAGVLDGEGHTIYNFVYQPAQAENVGLFATNGGTIKNLNFKDFSYTLSHLHISSNVGFLAGTNTGTIENVNIINASTAFDLFTHSRESHLAYYGSISGNNSGNIINCSITDSSMYFDVYSESWYSDYPQAYIYGGSLVGINKGSVYNSRAAINTETNITKNVLHAGWPDSRIYLGGLISVNDNLVKECKSTLEVTSTAGGTGERCVFIGGFAAYNNSEIEKCSSAVIIKIDKNHNHSSASGFVFENRGTIKNSHAEAEIDNASSGSYVYGGFAAYNYGGIDHCYAKGTMSVGAATLGKGGFAGYNDGSINSCFTDVNITATDSTLYGPFVGNADTASYITNCYYNNKSTFITNGEPQLFDATYAEAADPLNLTDKEFIVGTLGWSEDVWECDPNKFNHPTLK